VTPMRCLRCDRPLTKLAASIETRDGIRGWGSTCSRYVVIKPTRRLDRQPRVEYRQRATERDPAQLDWIEAIA
jgi:hypothetical protein